MTYRFINYTPSILEEAWYRNKGLYIDNASRICSDLDTHAQELASWVSFNTNHLKNNTYDEKLWSGVDDVFSKFVYEKSNGETFTRIIEPLVGHFRHPYALPHCKPMNAEAVNVQDRSYVAFGGLKPLDNDVFFSGKHYLFDLGTADFPTSLGYLIATYAKIGVEFDRIWAWESTPRPKYWDSVPSEVQGKLHFYNKGISSDIDAQSHPLQILSKFYQPGDYVVFKLDIDNSELEMSVMKEIMEDEHLQHIISELMFEMHYDSPDMERYFGKPNMSYINVLETFRSCRQKGIFLHYWP
ncbi:hypothetical protein M9435_002479 [Picochlorum sp. BPE23]|nr:hypothetical protein M9435_002479 [Picochlorum sp. BPE23]